MNEQQAHHSKGRDVLKALFEETRVLQQIRRPLRSGAREQWHRPAMRLIAAEGVLHVGIADVDHDAVIEFDPRRRSSGLSVANATFDLGIVESPDDVVHLRLALTPPLLCHASVDRVLVLVHPRSCFTDQSRLRRRALDPVVLAALKDCEKEAPHEGEKRCAHCSPPVVIKKN